MDARKSKGKGDVMKVEIQVDPTCVDTHIIITCRQIDDEISHMAKLLEERNTQFIVGVKEDTMTLLEPHSLIRIYGEAGKVMAITKQGQYQLRLRLYELEECLDPQRFVRISNSEIINLKEVMNFDLSAAGTIRVNMSDHNHTYVSRRYVTKIKRILGIVR